MTVQSEIIIEVDKEEVKARSKGGAVRKGVLHLDQLRLATIKVFEELLLDDTIHNRRHMEVLGQHLYTGLFDDPIDKLLNDELREVKKDRLRLQLQFESNVDPEIARLPWEFLYSPTRQDFLATDVNLVLSRYMELGQNREAFSASESILRVLVVISRPQDERVVLAKEVVSFINSLNKEGQDPIISLQVVDPPNLQNIEVALKQHQPHIFHFIGHGQYDPTQKTGFLLLVNPDTNNSEKCDDSTVIDCFKRSQCYPRLVFLHMCDSGIAEKDATIQQAFSGFAPKLIHAKIASVVAMQYPIKNQDACDFSLAFYSTLADGRSVDEAVQEGRSKLDLYRRSRLFGTPVLYMHSADGLVLPKTPPELPKPVISSSIQVGVKDTFTKPASGTAPKPVPVDQAVLDQFLNVGLEAVKKSISDIDTKSALGKRLLNYKKDFVGKTRPEIFDILLQAWQNEEDKSCKEVLLDVMEVIET